jgi:nucleotide-binding universal stress UspA family protein
MAYHCRIGGPAAYESERAEINGLLEAAVRKKLSLPNPGSDLEWQTFVGDGDPAETIAREAALRRVDLIVMCSRRRPMRAALLGSTTEAVCRIAPCPVLVTHPAGPARSDAPSRSVGLKRILIAYDFSADSELALNNGLSLALEFNAELHLLHVLSNTYRALESAAQQSQDEFGETGQRLRRVLPREAALGRDLKIALRKGPVYREVLNYADDRKVDLICMGASGSGYGMHALFGSNSDRVVRQARCPILIARPLRPA